MTFNWMIHFPKIKKKPVRLLTLCSLIFLTTAFLEMISQKSSVEKEIEPRKLQVFGLCGALVLLVI